MWVCKVHWHSSTNSPSLTVLMWKIKKNFSQEFLTNNEEQNSAADFNVTFIRALPEKEQMESMQDLFWVI